MPPSKINIKLQKAFQEKVFGRPAPGGHFYGIHYTEIGVFAELTFTFNQKLKHYEADLTARKDPTKESVYETEYTPGKKNYSNAIDAFTKLGHLLGISFDENSDFHGKLIVSDKKVYKH